MFGDKREWYGHGRTPRWDPRLREDSSTRSRLIARVGRDLNALLRNETETRRLLSQDVYRVPEAWLDEVLRVRVGDLVGSGRV